MMIGKLEVLDAGSNTCSQSNDGSLSCWASYSRLMPSNNKRGNVSEHKDGFRNGKENNKSALRKVTRDIK